MTVLNRIKAYKLQEIETAKRHKSLNSLEAEIKFQTQPRGFLNKLQEKKLNSHIGLIAEIKRASPSKGLIRKKFNVVDIAQAYQRGGACCLSILTDQPSFQGDNSFLSLGRDCVDLPVLRKDFMFDPYQIIQSRALGADCILLIMACLEDNQAVELEEVAIEYGMDVLIETHNQSEIERALSFLKSDLIGINNRNLHSFQTDLSVTTQLSGLLPKEKLCVSESGINSYEDIQKIQACNVQSFLIGESLMRQENIYEATKKILADNYDAL